ncbi:Glutathione S-transferase L3 [Platanthera zijinensis]|uniref:Glutathione S-transferase L3 n=1 Tax=Platanthera zijinensis TaxID=2320716 RepID=A0AAP0ASH1_9ASPA
MAAAVAAEYTKEELPSSLDATAEPPALFDGTTRLYISYTCPYAQRTWIARNYKVNNSFVNLPSHFIIFIYSIWPKF